MSSILNTTVMARLNKTNYLIWHVHMCALLICNDLWGVVSGKESPPHLTKASPMKIDNFMSCQLKAATEIVLYVDDSQIIHVQGDDPQVIRDSLTSVHRARGLSTQLAAMCKFSCMEKRPEQSIISWIGDVKMQAYLIKDIRIKLPDLFIIVVLTSGLPPDYESVIVALDVIKPDELTLELATSRLLNEEEHHLSHRQLDNYKALLVKNGSDSSVDAAFVARS
jgi:hypothetical protein